MCGVSVDDECGGVCSDSVQCGVEGWTKGI